MTDKTYITIWNFPPEERTFNICMHHLRDFTRKENRIALLKIDTGIPPKLKEPCRIQCLLEGLL